MKAKANDSEIQDLIKIRQATAPITIQIELRDVIVTTVRVSYAALRLDYKRYGARHEEHLALSLGDYLTNASETRAL